MVPYAETLQGRLAAALAGRFRVYSIAASGAPLSQYLVFAGHAVREFGAGAAVINVVGNDFDESLAAYKLGPGFWLYAPDAAGTLRLRLTEHNRAGWSRSRAARSPAISSSTCVCRRASDVCVRWSRMPSRDRPMRRRAMPATPTRRSIKSG